LKFSSYQVIISPMTDEARRLALIDRIDAVRERWRQLVAEVGTDRVIAP